MGAGSTASASLGALAGRQALGSTHASLTRVGIHEQPGAIGPDVVGMERLVQQNVPQLVGLHPGLALVAHGVAIEDQCVRHAAAVGFDERLALAVAIDEAIDEED